jgi:hypothetical protein
MYSSRTGATHQSVRQDVSVRAIKAPARTIGVLVSEGGTKTFIVMVGNGQRRTIGKVGIITLADACVQAITVGAFWGGFMR